MAGNSYHVRLQLLEASDGKAPAGAGRFEGFFPIGSEGRTKGRIYTEDTIQDSFLASLHNRCVSGKALMRVGHPTDDPMQKEKDRQSAQVRRAAKYDKAERGVDENGREGIRLIGTIINNEFGRNLRSQIEAGVAVELSPHVLFPSVTKGDDGIEYVHGSSQFSWAHFDWVDEGEFAGSEVTSLLEKTDDNIPTTKEKEPMNIDELNEKHPDIVKLIQEQTEEKATLAADKTWRAKLAETNTVHQKEVDARDGTIADLRTDSEAAKAEAANEKTRADTAEASLEAEQAAKTAAEAKNALRAHMDAKIDAEPYAVVIRGEMAMIAKDRGCDGPVEDAFTDEKDLDASLAAAKRHAESMAKAKPAVKGVESGDSVITGDDEGEGDAGDTDPFDASVKSAIGAKV